MPEQLTAFGGGWTCKLWCSGFVHHTQFAPCILVAWEMAACGIRVVGVQVKVRMPGEAYGVCVCVCVCVCEGGAAGSDGTGQTLKTSFNK